MNIVAVIGELIVVIIKMGRFILRVSPVGLYGINTFYENSDAPLLAVLRA